ncbi:MAG: hypothetical protein A2571_03230 [Candidatus Vogelbacteria bacterium RIFOXYD1_FULL_44_32]|uniref:Carbohydrate kinase PfkB domain-containing protein n=1 Tax=Candidatus Vogelbacteria bacterium RIFOXYD1_FULL_44_32 TaxID=1802438 RepID=A0A1G2QCV3_9BACT|nr:MAG: hypothetical protein A2571_03230 [Candidatus Vogelbacteria bacterium RIFOXYD1_FULL_44_32]
MNKKLDILAIGDITTDAFIKLQEAEVNCDINKDNCKICLAFGDKIPYESVTIVPAVGNSPNAAVSASRLGLTTGLLTNIGDDDEGKEALASLAKENVATDLVKTNAGQKTNYHYVLWYGAERTILIKHEKYDYSLPDIGNPRWIYLSSLGENSLDFHHQLATWLLAHPETKLAFQPGTFQINLGPDKLPDIFARTEIFVCNLEEARRILKTPDETDVKNLLTSIKNLGPKIVGLTDGPNGAYTFDGTDMWQMPIYPDPKSPISRTGAGDAFASTFTSFIALGMSVPEALKRAPINSMSVVQSVGAQSGLLTKEKIEKYLAEAPADYAPKKL